MDLESSRNKNVVVNTMSRTGFTTMAVILSVSLIGLLVGSEFLPQQIITRPPVDGQNVDILNQYACVGDMIDKNSPQVDQCWGHRFIFPPSNDLSQYFSLSMTVHRTMVSSNTDGNHNLQLQILWQGSKDFDENDAAVSTWEPIADASTTRLVTFGTNQLDSTEVTLFKSNLVVYKAYYFQIQFLDNVNSIPFVSSVSFSTSYENTNWVKWMIGLKSTFLGLSIIVAVMYRVYLRTVKSRLRSYEQSSVGFIVIAIVFYNNPLYFLEYVLPRNIFGWTDALFQFFFLACLFIYWLITFDGMARDPPFAFKTFYLPKIVFVTFYAVLGVALYTSVQILESSNPLYNWIQDVTLFRLIMAYGIITAISYFLWLGKLLVNGLIQERSMNRRQKAAYLYHFFVILMTVGGLLAVAITTEYYSSPSDYVYFYVVFNLYVYSLAYMYLPSSARSDGGLDTRSADLFAAPNYGGAIVLDSNNNSTSVNMKPGSVRSRAKRRGSSSELQMGPSGTLIGI